MSRVLLIGQGPTAAAALESLMARFQVVGVIRSTVSADDPVIGLAAPRGIRVYSDATVAGIQRAIESLTPDCVVVSSYDRIFSPALIARSRFVNVHYADLPRYRGRATVNWAVINGDSHTAITIHELRPELDGGPILFKQCVPIGANDTVSSLYERLNAIQRTALGVAVEAFLAGEPGRAQIEQDATYACTRLPRDGDIDWRLPTKTIAALVRALVAPFPGAFTYLAGERLTIWSAEAVADPPSYDGRVPGRVVGRSAADGWTDVLTGDGVLRLFEVQRDGEARAPAARHIRSVKATLGMGTIDLLDRIRLLEGRIAQLTHTVEGLIDDHGQTDSHHGRRGSDRIAYRGSGRPAAAR